MSPNRGVIKLALLVSCVLCLFTSQSSAQSNVRGLPNDAKVVETRNVPSPGHPNRMLVLWMVNPKKNSTNYAGDEMYSCPEQTRGSHYSGPTRVSLIDSASGKLINTVKILTGDGEEDSFDLPYAIRKGYYYRVPAMVKTGIEAKPNLIWLKDYNGDGRALEFALFDAVACMGLQTTLIGYSEKQDRVIQYPVKLDVVEGTKHSQRVSPWADYLFNQKPRRPGYWKYEIDYRGRAGSLDKWEVRYNPAREQFEGTLNLIAGDQP
jgi:hypothetical protein